MGKNIRKEIQQSQQIEDEVVNKKLLTFSKHSATTHLKFYETDIEKNYKHNMLFGKEKSNNI